ncbi:MAG: diguanylate cyclase [Tindallia sp. MSAO_Bac2]|nr:MAG: diguanylate cyclase [Tindallia sp. MSAO_Bac2]
MTEKIFYRALFDNSRDAIALIDLNLKILKINPRFTELFGYSSQESTGQYIDSLLLPASQQESGHQLNHQILSGEVIESEEVRHTKNDQLIDVLIKGIPVMKSNKIDQAFVLYTDIRKRKTAESSIHYLSFHDNMTGLYNRAYFEEELNRLDNPRRYPLSLIMADANNLKLTNDAFGHAAGDKLLITIADILKQVCRQDDVVARVGGDEFVLLLPNTGESEAQKVIDRIRNSCEEIDADPIPVSVALGAATKFDQDQTLHSIYQKAEDRMYEDKLLRHHKDQSSLVHKLVQLLESRTWLSTEKRLQVKDLVLRLGKQMDLPDDELYELFLLAMFHDVGKVGVPVDILKKPGPLSPAEYEIVKKYCEIGFRISLSAPQIAIVAHDILSQQEKWDGHGYPQQLKGTEIPFFARMISVVTSYIAMTTPRPYAKALSQEEAIDELLKSSGSQFDPEIVKVFINEILQTE